MTFIKKYVAFWEKIDTALGSFEDGIRLWEAEQRWKEQHLEAHPTPYKRWADSPHQFKAGPSGKPLLKLQELLYENRLSRWLAGK